MNVKLFEVEDIYSTETIPSVAHKLGCSQATMYRTLIHAQIPFYCLPLHPGSVYLHSSSLWRLAKTAAFKKYIKRTCLQWVLISCADSLANLINDGCLSLTIDQAKQAAACGLIPYNEEGVLPWFVLVLQGKLVFPLQIKAQ